ncbi:MAG: MFS transporter [Gammaproteobacteria bacterium]|nr:MFS transporter [Gammaproteobacteria bacterium]
MNRQEWRAALAVGLLYLIRMMGLFMVIPVLPIAEDQFNLSTPFLIGIAIGVHGFTQALLQIPFGLMSDRFGRKKLITVGLLLFISGSFIAAFSQNVYGLIAGRALQGCGAIASTLLALMSDLTRVEQRTKSMTVIGVAIAISFGIALLVGPALSHIYGVRSLFLFSGVSGLLGLLILYTIIPTPKLMTQNLDLKFQMARVREALSDFSFLRLNMSTLILHYLLISGFCVFPLLFDVTGEIDRAEHSFYYLILLIASLFVIAPFIYFSDRWHQTKPIFLIMVGSCVCSSLLLTEVRSFYLVLLGIGLFFACFNLLETMLPSEVGKISPAGARGTYMGFFMTSQFFGFFLGGVMGGWMLVSRDISFLFAINTVVAFCWFLILMTMAQADNIESRTIQLAEIRNGSAKEVLKELLSTRGVLDAVVIEQENVAYLKVDRSKFTDGSI